MFTLGYSFRPWTDAEGDRRRPVDPARTSATPPASTASTSTSGSTTAWSRADWSTATSAAGRSSVRSHRHRRARHDHLRVSVRLHAATTATTRATRPTFPGVERFRGPVVHPQHWPEDLDYTRQAGRRDRQRRDRGDAGARAGRASRARDDAAALADLRRRRCPAQRPDRRRGCARWLPQRARLRDRPLEERACRRSRSSSSSRRRPEADEVDAAQGRRSSSCPRATTSTPTSRRVQPVGPAAVPGSRRRSVHGDPRRPRVGRHRPHRHVHRDRHPAASPAPSSRPTSSSPPPA